MSSIQKNKFQENVEVLISLENTRCPHDHQDRNVGLFLKVLWYLSIISNWVGPELLIVAGFFQNHVTKFKFKTLNTSPLSLPYLYLFSGRVKCVCPFECNYTTGFSQIPGFSHASVFQLFLMKIYSHSCDLQEYYEIVGESRPLCIFSHTCWFFFTEMHL